jgi:hypothetical protein
MTMTGISIARARFQNNFCTGIQCDRLTFAEFVKLQNQAQSSTSGEDSRLPAGRSAWRKIGEGSAVALTAKASFRTGNFI